MRPMSDLSVKLSLYSDILFVGETVQEIPFLNFSFAQLIHHDLV
jgi:hypothetical protein